MQVLGEMQAEGLTMNGLTYYLQVQGSIAKRDMNAAIDTLHQMQKKSLNPPLVLCDQVRLTLLQPRSH